MQGAAVDELLGALRELANADVLYNAAVAERLGVSAVDLRCLSYLDAHGAATASELARWSGLTSGALTGVVNRLAAAGLVRRDPDPEDARRVRIIPLPEQREEIESLMRPLGQRLAAAASDLSPDQQQVLTKFVVAACTAMSQEALRIRHFIE